MFVLCWASLHVVCRCLNVVVVVVHLVVYDVVLCLFCFDLPLWFSCVCCVLSMMC